MLCHPSTMDPADIDVEVRKCIGAGEGQITQTELARRAGVSKRYVSQVLSGETVADGGRHQARAKALLLFHAAGLAHLDLTGKE